MEHEAYEANVANGGTIELPGLSEEDMENGRSPETRMYIRQNLHHPSWIGWPAIEEFGKTGVLIQALDDQTARALLVIDDKHAKRFLSVLRYAYDYIGYTLHIDHATVFRTPWERPEHDSVPEIKHEVQPSMEVA